ILVKGTFSGTVSDVDGNYSIEIPDEAEILVFSSIGYITQEVNLNGRTVIDVVLEADVQSLDEVVVTGYSTQRKKDITGSVAVVDTESLSSFPTGSVSKALQGQISGVTVISSGVPGGRSNIFIRGITSFGDTQPLVLVDGVQGSLDGLNMNDIESMQVRKDAGAAAIYGVRGSNGVIVITTKKGGEPRITYDAFYGITTVKKGNVYNLLNSEDYA